MNGGVNPNKRKCVKRRYRDRVGALMALANIQGDRHGRPERRYREARAYECPSCKGWHLTSMEESK